MEKIPLTRIETVPGKDFVIILCSDSHGNKDCLAYLKKTYPDADVFVHCGDSELEEKDMDGFLTVRGNHDWYYNGSIPDHRILEAAGHRFYICHGHLDILIYFHYDQMAKHARQYNCDTVFFGHMHICQDFMEGGVRMLNPGSISYSRDGSGRSYMVVTVTPEGIRAERKQYTPPQPPSRPKRPGLLERLLAKLD